MAPLPESLGAPALRANSGKGDRICVASGFCASSTKVGFPHFAQLNCTRGRPTSCASGRECCAPQLEQATFIASFPKNNLARLLTAGRRRRLKSSWAAIRTSVQVLQGWHVGTCNFFRGLKKAGHAVLSLVRTRKPEPGAEVRCRLCP
jgi:hypothetical protein